MHHPGVPACSGVPFARYGKPFVVNRQGEQREESQSKEDCRPFISRRSGRFSRPA